MLSLFSCSSPKPVGQFKGYEYVKHGCTAWPMENYKLYYNDEGALVIDVETEYNVVKTIPAPADLPEKIDALVKEYKLWRLKENYKPPFQVLDGYNWYLYIRYEGNYTYSSGSNAWPRESLRDGIKAINALLHEVVEAAGVEINF